MKPHTHRGTSFIITIASLGPYSRSMPRAIWWSEGGLPFLMSEVPLQSEHRWTRAARGPLQLTRSQALKTKGLTVFLMCAMFAGQRQEEYLFASSWSLGLRIDSLLSFSLSLPQPLSLSLARTLPDLFASSWSLGLGIDWARCILRAFSPCVHPARGCRLFNYYDFECSITMGLLE